MRAGAPPPAGRAGTRRVRAGTRRASQRAAMKPPSSWHGVGPTITTGEKAESGGPARGRGGSRRHCDRAHPGPVGRPGAGGPTVTGRWARDSDFAPRPPASRDSGGQVTVTMPVEHRDSRGSQALRGHGPTRRLPGCGGARSAASRRLAGPASHWHGGGLWTGAAARLSPSREHARRRRKGARAPAGRRRKPLSRTLAGLAALAMRKG